MIRRGRSPVRMPWMPRALTRAGISTTTSSAMPGMQPRFGMLTWKTLGRSLAIASMIVTFVSPVGVGEKTSVTLAAGSAARRATSSTRPETRLTWRSNQPSGSSCQRRSVSASAWYQRK